MKDIYILLGSNRGEREATLRQAAEMIATLAGSVRRVSQLYETEPWGFRDPVLFLNQVIEIESEYSPEELLERLLAIEARLGRIRPFDGCGCGIGDGPAYLARTIDLDILFYGNRLAFSDRLMVPHPRLHERKFTLIPLHELAPEFIHPILKKSVAELLRDCNDPSQVTVWESNGPER